MITTFQLHFLKKYKLTAYTPTVVSYTAGRKADICNYRCCFSRSHVTRGSHISSHEPGGSLYASILIGDESAVNRAGMEEIFIWYTINLTKMVTMLLTKGCAIEKSK